MTKQGSLRVRPPLRRTPGTSVQRGAALLTEKALPPQQLENLWKLSATSTANSEGRPFSVSKVPHPKQLKNNVKHCGLCQDLGGAGAVDEGFHASIPNLIEGDEKHLHSPR